LFGLISVRCLNLSKNQTIFENPVCQPPCWENITPGLTTKENALAILSTTEVVDQPVLDPNRPNIGFDDEIQFTVNYEKGGFSGWVYILDDRVSMIGFQGKLVTMQNAIKLFGMPESILLVQTGHFDQVTLLNSQKGIAFGYKLFGASSLDSTGVESNIEVSDLAFFDPNQYERVLDSGNLSAYTLNPEETKRNLHPWKGYGSFKEKYWPPAIPTTP